MAAGTVSDIAASDLLAAKLKRWRWSVFASTWLCYAGFYFGRKPFSVAKSRIGLELLLDAEQLALIGSAYLIAYTIGQFASGALGPLFGPRRMLLVGLAVSIATGVGFAFISGTYDFVPRLAHAGSVGAAVDGYRGVLGLLTTPHTFAAFVVLSTVNGFAQATGWSNCVGTMANWFHRTERGTVMGLWATCFQVGNIAAPALTAWALQAFGLRWAFLSGSIALAFVWLIVFLFQANRPEDKGLPEIVEQEPMAAPAESSGDGVVRWSRDTWITVWLVGGAYFGMKFIRYALDSWAPFFLSRKFHLQDDEAGYLSTVFGISGIASVIATGWLSDKVFGGRRGLPSFIMIVGVVIATVLINTHVGTQSAVAFATCTGLIGFALYGPDALLTGAGAMDIGGGVGAVRAAGIISGLGSAGAVVQELVIGVLYKRYAGEMAPILATLLVAALLAFGCMTVILVRNRQGKSDV